MARPRNLDRLEREKRASPATEQPLYYTWNEGDSKARAYAMQQCAADADKFDGVVMKSSSNYNSAGDSPNGIDSQFRHTGSNSGAFAGDSILGGNGAKPIRPRDIIYQCMRAYDEFGIVRNIIDTMSDFTTQGVGLSHPNPRIEKFYKEWFNKVDGHAISEHIASTLFLAANAPVRRHTAKLKPKDIANLQKGIAAESPTPPFLLGKHEIPWRYTIMNPLQTVVLGGDLAPFIGPNAYTYAVTIPANVMAMMKRPKNAIEKQLLSRLPDDIRQNIKDGMSVIPLAHDQMTMLSYKRRHWQVWATPMTYPILDDLNMLRKLKRADAAALDGAISHVRLWKLGSLEQRMMPTAKAMQHLADLLANVGNGNAMDLIWGPAIELQETSTEIHRFLGDKKYAAHLAAIFAGYGIPPTLIGAAITGGMTNNFISLKTLTERLQYVRRIIKEFWEAEVKLVQHAMSFKLPASIHFDRMVLTDEVAEKALLIQMVDRDLISAETLQQRFGEDPMLEVVRQRREQRMRDKKKMPQKAGAFHNPQTDVDILKQFITQGMVTPTQTGIEMLDREPGEITLVENQNMQADKVNQNKLEADKQARDHDLKTQRLQMDNGVHPGQLQKLTIKQAGVAPATKRKGQPNQGRPNNSKDSKKRKKKEVKIRTKANLIACLSWAEDSMTAIAEKTAPLYLKATGKKNLRQLTTEEGDSFETFKFALLINLPVGSALDEKALAALIKNPLPIPNMTSALLKATIEAHRKKDDKEPSLEKKREFMTRIVAIQKAELSTM